jgi:hypothetical protein
MTLRTSISAGLVALTLGAERAVSASILSANPTGRQISISPIGPRARGMRKHRPGGGDRIARETRGDFLI